jgi:GR25 family glycosyltransferase involved in LPS biosynthesis
MQRFKKLRRHLAIKYNWKKIIPASKSVFESFQFKFRFFFFVFVFCFIFFRQHEIDTINSSYVRFIALTEAIDQSSCEICLQAAVTNSITAIIETSSFPGFSRPLRSLNAMKYFLKNSTFLTSHGIDEKSFLIVFNVEDVHILKNSFVVQSNEILSRIIVPVHMAECNSGYEFRIQNKLLCFTMFAGQTKKILDAIPNLFDVPYLLNSSNVVVDAFHSIFCSLGAYSSQCQNESPILYFHGNRTYQHVFFQSLLKPYFSNQQHQDILKASRFISLPWFKTNCIQPENKQLLNPVYIYWINLKTSWKRKLLTWMQMRELESKLRVKTHRIEAVDVSGVERMISLSTIALPSWLTLVHEASPEGKQSGNYSYKELACLLSHLTAIRTAFSHGHNYALIMEDDAVLNPYFLENIDSFLNLAPLNWQVLQLYTLNSLVTSQLSSLQFNIFIKWFPDHWSTAAYIINRAGMQRLLSVFDSSSMGVWKIPSQHRMLAADEIIFYYTHSYTSAVDAISVRTTESTIQSSRGIDPSLPNHHYSTKGFCEAMNSTPIPKYPLSMLVFTTARISTRVEFLKQKVLFANNVASLRRYVKQSSWIIYLVFNDFALLSLIRHEITLNSLDHVRFVFRIHHGRYNKFFFLAEILVELPQFQKFLLVDSDFNLDGFPWSDFFARSENSVISGTTRRQIEQDIYENMFKPTRQWFKLMDNKWWSKNMPDTQVTKTYFIEQSFAVFDSRFSQWFFSQILTSKYLTYISNDSRHLIESDFGPDLLWCGAAFDWISRLSHSIHIQPCVLVILPIEHCDFRQITDQSFDIVDPALREVKKRIELRPLHLLQRDFSSWFEYSCQFTNQIGGKSDFDNKFKQWMKQLTLSPGIQCV